MSGPESAWMSGYRAADVERQGQGLWHLTIPRSLGTTQYTTFQNGQAAGSAVLRVAACGTPEAQWHPTVSNHLRPFCYGKGGKPWAWAAWAAGPPGWSACSRTPAATALHLAHTTGRPTVHHPLSVLLLLLLVPSDGAGVSANYGYLGRYEVPQYLPSHTV